MNRTMSIGPVWLGRSYWDHTRQSFDGEIKKHHFLPLACDINTSAVVSFQTIVHEIRFLSATRSPPLNSEVQTTTAVLTYFLCFIVSRFYLHYYDGVVKLCPPSKSSADSGNVLLNTPDYKKAARTATRCVRSAQWKRDLRFYTVWV